MLDKVQHTPLVEPSFGHSQALEVEELQQTFDHGAMAALDSNPWSTCKLMGAAHLATMHLPMATSWSHML